MLFLCANPPMGPHPNQSKSQSHHKELQDPRRELTPAPPSSPLRPTSHHSHPLSHCSSHSGPLNTFLPQGLHITCFPPKEHSPNIPKYPSASVLHCIQDPCSKVTSSGHPVSNSTSLSLPSLHPALLYIAPRHLLPSDPVFVMCLSVCPSCAF